MITSKSCIFCIAWEKEIGSTYPKTDIGKNYPLKRIEVDIYNEIKKNIKINITPTFIFYKNDQEIGRLTGFTNPEMFWWNVDEILGIN